MFEAGDVGAYCPVRPRRRQQSGSGRNGWTASGRTTRRPSPPASGSRRLRSGRSGELISPSRRCTRYASLLHAKRFVSDTSLQLVGEINGLHLLCTPDTPSLYHQYVSPLCIRFQTCTQAPALCTQQLGAWLLCSSAIASAVLADMPLTCCPIRRRPQLATCTRIGA